MKILKSLHFKTLVFALLIALLMGLQSQAAPKADVSYDKVLNRTRVSIQERLKRKSSGIFGGNAVSTIYYVIFYDYEGKTPTYPPVLQWSFRRTTNEKNRFDVSMHKQQWADVTRVTLTAQGQKFEFTPFYDTDFNSKGTLFGQKFSTEERLSISISPETLEQIAKSSTIGFALESNSKIVASDDLDGGNLDSLSSILETLPKDKKMAVLPLSKSPVAGQTYTDVFYDAMDDLSYSRAMVIYSPAAAIQAVYKYPGKDALAPDTVRVGYLKTGEGNAWKNAFIKMRFSGEVKQYEADFKQTGDAKNPLESLGADVPLKDFRAICQSEEVIFRAGDNPADTITLKGYLLLPFQEILRQIDALPKAKEQTQTPVMEE